MAAPQPISVDFDATFLVQVVLFVALTVALKPLLFDPMLKLFEEREKLIDGSKLQARRIDEKSATALAQYEAEMAKARALGNTERERVHAEALRREQEILSAARAQSALVLEAGRRAAQAQADRARAALKTESSALARDLGARVLGRQVSS
jgi:F-type H+-transporting ATPase subunit b